MRRLLLAHALFLFAAIAPTFARADQDRASFGNDITVAEGETAADIACAFCSVRVHGNVKGDVAVLFGTISVDDNQAISGDVAILGGDLNLHNEAQVGGDVAIAAGNANLAPGAAIRCVYDPLTVEVLFTVENATKAEVHQRVAAVVGAIETVVPSAFDTDTATRSADPRELIPA